MRYWIARDNDHRLYLYDEKPVINEGQYRAITGLMYDIDEYLFPDVTFSNSPKLIEISFNITE